MSAISRYGIRDLRADTFLHDVDFIFDNGAVRGAHRCVLALQSPVFRSMFDPSQPWGTKKEVRLIGKDIDEFDVLLEYFYLEEECLITLENAAPLLMLSEEYQVHSLKLICENFLVEHMASDSCVDLLQLAEVYRCERLSQCAKALLIKEFESVAASENFARLPAPRLAEVLASDELCVQARLTRMFLRICHTPTFCAFVTRP
tara:strand:+ start:333 stop:941 length:609 start_codon:yes stop_codon:yes gene_type:complete